MRAVAAACAVFVVAVALSQCGCSRAGGPVERVSWNSMGTVATLHVRGMGLGEGSPARKAVSAAMAASREIESLFNAHDKGSELSRLACRSEEEIVALCGAGSKEDAAVAARRCYKAAFQLAKASGQAFNPRWKGPSTLDLGAIAKGLAVDLAAERIAALVADGSIPNGVGILVDFGGNLKAVAGSWKVGVKNPAGEGYSANVELNEGESIATSARYFRGDHIRDGRTGGAVTADVASVTVRCRSAMWADGLSTTLFVLGPNDGQRFVETSLPADCASDFISALWILADGRKVECEKQR